MDKRPKYGVNARWIATVVLALIAAAGVLSSTALAAPAQNATTASAGQVRMLDPFLVRMITLTNAMSASNQARLAVARLELASSLRPIRIPARLPERSAFRPQYIGR